MQILLLHYFVYFSIITKAGCLDSSESGVHKNKAEAFPDDFMTFIRDMGQIIFHHPDDRRYSKEEQNIIIPNKPGLNSSIRKSEITTPVRGLLMMKLVSYYEDKYKLSRRATSTTESIYHDLHTPRTKNRRLYKQNRITEDLSKGYKDDESAVIVL